MLGDDLLSMEDKERFIKTIEEVNNDELVLEEWMSEENARLKREGEMDTAYNDGVNEGIEQGAENNKKEVIINMLREGAAYEFISKVTGKSIEEIKEIEGSIQYY